MPEKDTYRRFEIHRKYLKIEDTFLHPLNAARCDIHITFLGCNLEMIG